MAEGGSITVFNVGELSKPATVLVEKIADAVGGIARPGQIIRVAKAEAKAEIIRAEAKIKISEIERRALIRMVTEEGRKQENIENITAKALPNLSENAKPEEVETDWLSNFFDRCRLSSDDQMQALWASILAGEANSPGSFSKRTIETVATLSKKDAELFTKFCTFCWMIGVVTPIILDVSNEIFAKNGINFNSLNHLEDIGLIKFDNLAGYVRIMAAQTGKIFYYGKSVDLQLPTDKFHFPLGKVLFTTVGEELCKIVQSEDSQDYYAYTVSEWRKHGCIISE